jgi:pentatricopeptide repeat protein
MYAKCGVIADAMKVFEEMLERDVVAWNTVVSGCIRNGEYLMGLRYPPHLAVYLNSFN